MVDMRPVALLIFALSLPSVVPASAQPVWQSGKIVRAEQPERRKPEPYEVWNPWLTHWYTIDTGSAVIKATEMVPSGVRRQGTRADLDRDPPMAFRAGESVRFTLQDPPPGPKKKRELYVLDRKGKQHTLTVDTIVPHGTH
jgi:hypothetical protein